MTSRPPRSRDQSRATESGSDGTPNQLTHSPGPTRLATATSAHPMHLQCKENPRRPRSQAGPSVARRAFSRSTHAGLKD
ncbi:hypothetical protein ElyMa_005853200 [Elysia marginata]|uniref:Uncharacterized protein n=1 Tax=Elysia marginata TaxID=1093978 RepID=A0AAV4FZD0_9GAST|nr:hypothetical protein ElyMa_005853200 [Elysia marginata]